MCVSAGECQINVKCLEHYFTTVKPAKGDDPPFGCGLVGIQYTNLRLQRDLTPTQYDGVSFFYYLCRIISLYIILNDFLVGKNIGFSS